MRVKRNCCILFLAELAVLFLSGAVDISWCQETDDVYVKALQRADELLAQGETKDAEMAYRQVLVLKPNLMEALLGLTKVAREGEKWQDFREWVTRALQIEPDNPEAKELWQNDYVVHDWIERGDSLRLAGHAKEAEKSYKEARKLDGEYFAIYRGLALLAYDKGEMKTFIELLNKAQDLNPGNEELDALFERHPGYLKLIEDGNLLYKAGNRKDAYERYKDAAKINGSSRFLARRLGSLAYEAGDWGATKDWYEQLLRLGLPDDLEANYRRGVAFREGGLYSAHLVKLLAMRRSEGSFQKVMSVDPDYEDVYYQAALTERQQEDWTAMVRFGQQQVNRKPEMESAQVGLLFFYRILLARKSSASVDSFLVHTETGSWGDYIRGIQWRQDEEYDRADSTFRQLLIGSDFSKTAICLALVRNDLARGDREAAGRHFEQSLATLRTDIDAAFMFDASKYIFTDQELDFYRNLYTPDKKRVFFVSFWTARNPIPASPVNVRALEHFSRLNYAQKNYWYDLIRLERDNPDKTHQLSFPEAYRQNDCFNDKGLIYVRHGEPDRIARTSHIGLQNESWLYYASAIHPEMMFHFVIDVQLGTGNSWRLTPSFTQVELLKDRLGWHPSIDRLYMILNPKETGRFTAFKSPHHREQFQVPEVFQIESEMADYSQQVVEYAMSTDSHTWHKKNRIDLDVPYLIANRKGKNGKTHSEIYAGIPVAPLFSQDTKDAKEVRFEHGAGVFDDQWRKTAGDFQKVTISRSQTTRTYHGFLIEKYDFQLAPGTYHLSIYAQDESESKIGGWNVTTDVPAYAEDGLRLSDLLVAYDILPGIEDPRFRKGDVTVIPNPSKSFQLDEPVFVYFEIYGLSKDPDNDTRFRVETELTLLQEAKGALGKVFGKDQQKSIALQNDKTGTQSTTAEFSSLNVSKLDPGKYTLSVRITDWLTETSTSKSMDLELVR